MKMRKKLLLLGTLGALMIPAAAPAQVTFYVASESDRAFVIEGDDIEANSPVELTVVYDSQSLSHPQASLPQGTLTELRDSNGSLVISAVQGEDSSATFALHLSFDKVEGRSGGIFSVRGGITNPDGSVAFSRTLPAASSPTVLQTYSSDEDPPAEEGLSGGIPEIIGTEPNVLQRFRNFKGRRGLRAFLALFQRTPGERIVQDPPVLLSDGKALLKIHLALVEGEEQPDVALSDAKLLRLEREGEKGWLLTVLPSEGTWDASLVVRVDEKMYQFPLVVAPPLVGLKKELNEANYLAELDRFLLARAAEGPAENSGRRRAFWEYVFTCNYLGSALPAQFKVASDQAPAGDKK